ncbi:GntR family transcriptional regulator [Petroclostridium sp. X23]|jgi:GntR family transcriptional regulator|uniref:GntR family transcriptional regulator n=1 Tax=Petroclostridium sp. X23 TaxID=3045146 RepID=UPI0024AE5F70|nr:GntR family transcriptional regulator [Petroclostridium sp. X23]WHH60840.1 GntR family transcriptional regulator [Petroclostridium sp. X23]
MLNKNDVVPLYKQLQEELRKQIQSGERKPREKIPSEVDLAKQYHVSVITARKAVNELAEEGLVEKKQGKGTYIAAQKYQRNLQQVLSFSEVCRLNGTTAGSRLLECKLVEADPKTLRKLGRPDGEQVLFISRLRYMNGEPIAIETNQFSIAYSFLINENLNEGSLFDVLKKRSGTEVSISRRTLEICRATQQEAQHLLVVKGSPLLLIKSIAYSTENQPVFVGTQLINGERYQFTV